MPAASQSLLSGQVIWAPDSPLGTSERSTECPVGGSYKVNIMCAFFYELAIYLLQAGGSYCLSEVCGRYFTVLAEYAF